MRVKTSLAAIFASGILTTALLAGGYAAKQAGGAQPSPSAQPSPAAPDDVRQEVATFNARADYAKAHGVAATYANDGGPASCTVYTVKQGADGAPGYTLVVASDPAGGRAMVLSDTVTIDPAHSIKCTGHAIVIKNGMSLTKGGDDLVMELGLGKGDPLFKATGSSNMILIPR